jgi:hypothetical protein
LAINCVRHREVAPTFIRTAGTILELCFSHPLISLWRYRTEETVFLKWVDLQMRLSGAMSASCFCQQSTFIGCVKTVPTGTLMSPSLVAGLWSASRVTRTSSLQERSAPCTEHYPTSFHGYNNSDSIPNSTLYNPKSSKI